MKNEHDIEFDNLRKASPMGGDCGDLLISFQLNKLHAMHIDDVRALVAAVRAWEAIDENEEPSEKLRRMMENAIRSSMRRYERAQPQKETYICKKCGSYCYGDCESI